MVFLFVGVVMVFPFLRVAMVSRSWVLCMFFVWMPVIEPTKQRRSKFLVLPHRVNPRRLVRSWLSELDSGGFHENFVLPESNMSDCAGRG